LLYIMLRLLKFLKTFKVVNFSRNYVLRILSCFTIKTYTENRINRPRKFTHQILTCVGVRLISWARCSRSGADKYFCCLKRRSSSYTCAWVNSTRRFRRWASGNWMPAAAALAGSIIPSPAIDMPAPAKRGTEFGRF